MLRRLFSTSPSNKLNCVDCRLYNRTTKLCAFNKLNAFENRLNETICGLDGKKFWSLDKTHLIESERYSRVAALFGIYGIISAPCSIVIDIRLLVTSFASFYFADIFADMSGESKQKYLDDNQIKNT